MKARKVLNIVMAIGMIGTAGSADNVPAAATGERSVVDMFVMRDDVRFTETEESGRKRWEVRGTRAESQSADVIRVFNVKATFVKDDGEEICMYTEACDINRRTREIQTELRVDIVQGDSVLSGIGMRINHEVRRFHLFKDVQIVTQRKGALSLDSLK